MKYNIILKSFLFFLVSVVNFPFHSFSMEEFPKQGDLLPPLYKHIETGNINGIIECCQNTPPDKWYLFRHGMIPPVLIFTLLHKKQQEIIKTLVTYKADVNFEDHILHGEYGSKHDPVLLTALNKDCSFETIKTLLECKANASFYNSITKESLFHKSASKKNSTALCDLLVQNIRPNSFTVNTKNLITNLLVFNRKKNKTLFSTLPKQIMLYILSYSLPIGEIPLLPSPHSNISKKAIYEHILTNNPTLFGKNFTNSTPRDIALYNNNKELAELLTTNEQN